MDILHVIVINRARNIFSFRDRTRRRSAMINQRARVRTSYFNASTQQLPQDGASGRRCISWCKLSWPPSDWPVKWCLCHAAAANEAAAAKDDMSVSTDHFLSAFVGFHPSLAGGEFCKLLELSANRDRWTSSLRWFHTSQFCCRLHCSDRWVIGKLGFVASHLWQMIWRCVTDVTKWWAVWWMLDEFGCGQNSRILVLITNSAALQSLML